jgi:hypothetical protein
MTRYRNTTDGNGAPLLLSDERPAPKRRPRRIFVAASAELPVGYQWVEPEEGRAALLADDEVVTKVVADDRMDAFAGQGAAAMAARAVGQATSQRRSAFEQAKAEEAERQRVRNPNPLVEEARRYGELVPLREATRRCGLILGLVDVIKRDNGHFVPKAQLDKLRVRGNRTAGAAARVAQAVEDAQQQRSIASRRAARGRAAMRAARQRARQGR